MLFWFSLDWFDIKIDACILSVCVNMMITFGLVAHAVSEYTNTQQTGVTTEI